MILHDPGERLNRVVPLAVLDELPNVLQSGEDIVSCQLDLRVGNDTMVAAIDPVVGVKTQDTLRLAVNPARLHFFDAESENAI